MVHPRGTVVQGRAQNLSESHAWSCLRIWEEITSRHTQRHMLALCSSFYQADGASSTGPLESGATPLSQCAESAFEFVISFFVDFALISTHCRCFTVSFETDEPRALITRPDSRFLFAGSRPHHSRPQGQMTDSCWTHTQCVLSIVIVVVDGTAEQKVSKCGRASFGKTTVTTFNIGSHHVHRNNTHCTSIRL